MYGLSPGKICVAAYERFRKCSWYLRAFCKCLGLLYFYFYFNFGNAGHCVASFAMPEDS